MTFILISDGGVPGENLPPLPGPVEFIAVGSEADNLAVSGLAARTLPSGDRAELFVRATNYGPSERSAQLTVSRDGEPLFSNQVHLQPGESGSFVFDELPAEPSRFEARLANIQANLPLDSFPIDDTAYAVLSPQPVRRVLLVTEGNLFLERLLLLFTNLTASKTVPNEDGEILLPAEPFDLYILDGLIPGGEFPEGRLLLIDPPPNPLFSVLGTTAEVGEMGTTSHPLAQFIDWDPVNVFETRTIELPGWGQPLVMAGENPLVFIGSPGGRRVAVVAFDLHRSDLPLQVAFPILFSTLFEYLAPAGIVPDANSTRPGDPVSLDLPPGVETVEVTDPTGATTTLAVGGGSLLITETGEPGFYTVRLPDQPAGDDAVFAVNLFSEIESRIEPSGQVRIGQTTLDTTRPDSVSSREAWVWLILLALGFLSIEWAVYYRRLGAR